MARITGEQIYKALQSSVVPTSTFKVVLMGLDFPNIRRVVCNRSPDFLGFQMMWLTNDGAVHSHRIPEDELTEEELAALVVAMRIS